ncbi:hypothetical protein ABBQ32_005229 [Trebouxia sp. C0010 RCD-2024]
MKRRHVRPQMSTYCFPLAFKLSGCFAVEPDLLSNNTVCTQTTAHGARHAACLPSPSAAGALFQHGSWLGCTSLHELDLVHKRLEAVRLLHGQFRQNLPVDLNVVFLQTMHEC